MIEILPQTVPENQVVHETQRDLADLKSEIIDNPDELDNDALKHALETYDGGGILNLSHMNITDDDLFYASPKIALLKGVFEINLSHNSLLFIPTNSASFFSGCTKLISIDFSYNNIAQFDGKVFDKQVAGNLQEIKINNNSQHTRIDAISNFSVFKSLKRFYASGNAITSQSFLNYNDSKTKLKSLETLNLRDNLILNMDWLRMFPGLQILDIRENQFFNLSLLNMNQTDLSKSILTFAGSSFVGISKSKLKKLYIDEVIVDNLYELMSKIDGGDEVLRMRDKNGMEIVISL